MWEALLQANNRELQEEEELQSNQEEADTRPFLHARHTTKEPFNATVILAEDQRYAFSILLFQMTSKCWFSSFVFHSKWPDT